MKIFLLFSICFLETSPKIQERNLIETQTTQKSTANSKAEASCNQQMMTSYGLTGFSKPQNSTHKYCPSITSNCCTPEDATLSLQLWNSQGRKIIESYYETYLYSMKYILGYSIEGINLAEDFKNSENSKCKSAAQTYNEMNMNPQITQDVYSSFVQSLENIANLRKGFYCILCDATTQGKLKDYLWSTNLFYSDRIYFSQDFCKTLVEKTSRSSYLKITYFKKYAEALSTLISCQTNSKAVTFDVSYFNKQRIKNCYYFKDKYFFYFCENYCEEFHLVRASSIFDGELEQLKKFVDQIMENKHSAFDYPNNNILMWYVTYEEDLLRDNFEYVLDESIFFEAAGNTKLNSFKTDVLYSGGMNPWKSSESSLYELAIAGESLLAIVGVLMFIIHQ